MAEDPVKLLATALEEAVNSAALGLPHNAKRDWERLLRAALGTEPPERIMCMARDVAHVIATCGVTEEYSIIETTDTHVRYVYQLGMWLPGLAL